MDTQYPARRQAVAERLAERNLQALVVSSPVNVRYLSGFTGSNALLVVFAAGQPVLFTDPRYGIQAARETSLRTRIVRGGPLAPAGIKAAAGRGRRRIGFENLRIPFETHARLSEALPLGAELVPAGPLIEELRMVKSPREIEWIRRSAEVPISVTI